VYWAGDFNINILNADDHKATGDFLHTMMSNSFYPAITKPTRITEFSATIIDNIYCNATSNSLAGIVYKNISDHLPIFVMNDTEVKRVKEVRSVETRELSSGNIIKFQERIKNFDWSYITEINDVNDAYDNFLNDFTKHYDECCPVKTRRKRTDFRQKWMTPALLKSCKTKDKLYKKY